jgi:hypothetical protein
MNRLPCLAMAFSLCACGGAPFTVEFASIASGDDAQTPSPVADAGQDSAPADPDAAWWGGVDARDDGGDVQRSTDAADGGLGWIQSEAGEASLPDAIGPADAHADGGSPSDSASWFIDGGDSGTGLCCRTEVYPSCNLAWVPVDAGKVNDYCTAPSSCVASGVVVPCP